VVSLTVREHDRIEALAAAVKHVPAIRAVMIKPNGLDIRVDSPEKALPAILEAANRLTCQLEFIDYHRPRLDDVFIAHTGRSIKDDLPKEDGP
jgi:ABC-2 type transport system ATP-binding protein